MNQMRSFDILSYEDPRQREEWRSICRTFKEIDIFFYPEYVYLFELKGDGKAHCFVYYDGDNGIVIYPFLKRQINELPYFHDIPSDFIDITSPYGYGGYLRNNEQIDMNNFFKIFHEFCLQNRIVSEFIRFHPLLNNFAYSPDNVEVTESNEIVGIDLTMSSDAIWTNMNPSCRNKVRKAQKHNIKIIKDDNFDKLDYFCELYLNTMKRLKAHNYYYFSNQWFNSLIHNIPKNVALFHAYYSG